MSRDWQNWDAPKVAERVQIIWNEEPGELQHREQLTELISRHVPGLKGTFLDVGCGTGLVYKRLRAASNGAIDYTGVDVSLQMLRTARQNFPEALFLYGDGFNLVFRDAEIDCVLCFEVAGHVPHVRRLLHELLRVTGKICIFTVWPSETDEITEDYEEIEGAKFLHRKYPDSYIRQCILSAAPSGIKRIETERLRSGGRAYIVERAPFSA